MWAIVPSSPPGFGRPMARNRRLAARMVAEAQAKVAELEANHSSASDFACD